MVPPEVSVTTQVCKQKESTQNDISHHRLPAREVTESLDRPPEPTLKPEPYNRGRFDTLKRYDYTQPFHHGNTQKANQAAIEFAKFFARCELVTKGLKKYNYYPECHRAWQSSFQNLT